MNGFPIGSTSAQTFNESAQEATPQGMAQIGRNKSKFSQQAEVKGLLKALAEKTKYQVVHQWKPTAPGSITHHSQIVIKDMQGNDVYNFGLFAKDGVAMVLGRTQPPGKDYKVSTTYKPNPVIAMDNDIFKAYITAISACGEDYDILKNNCQKFGRLFMTALGAKHHRSLFHP